MTGMPPIPEIRLGSPIVEDWSYLARNMRPDEIAQHEAMTGYAFDPDVAARAFVMTPGSTFVLVSADNMPIVAGGFEPINARAYNGWMVGTMAGWEKHWRAITKWTRRLFDDALENGANRIQIIATADRLAAHEWYARGLGMQQEGVLQGYCADGTDAVMFAKTKEVPDVGRRQ